MSNLDYDSLINQLKRSTKDPKANLALGKLSQMLQTREGQELAQSFMQSADPMPWPGLPSAPRPATWRALRPRSPKSCPRRRARRPLPTSYKS